MIQKMKSRKGFTLIEMLVVIAIIAVLVAIIVPVVGNSTSKAKAAADAANLRSMAATVAIDYLDNGEINSDFPTTKSEVYPSSTPTFFEENGNITAYYNNGSAYVGVNEFANAAEVGGTPAPASPQPTGALSKTE